MNLRQKLYAVSAAAVLCAVAPQAFADGPKDKHKDCEPEILSSSVQGVPAVSHVSGYCLDLVDAVSTSGPATTKAAKVEVWLDGAFVPLTLVTVPTAGNVYTKTPATPAPGNVLETIGLCSTTLSGEGITTVRITRPSLSTSGKAKSRTEESTIAVAFKGNCPPPI